MQSARSAIVSRLKFVLGDEFKTIRGTSNYQAVTRQAWGTPACFVVGAGEKPLRSAWNEQEGGIPPAMLDYYLVLIVTPVERDDDGTAEDVSLLLGDKVRNALAGSDWVPFSINRMGYAGADIRHDLERNLLVRQCFFSLIRYTENDNG